MFKDEKVLLYEKIDGDVLDVKLGPLIYDEAMMALDLGCKGLNDLTKTYEHLDKATMELKDETFGETDKSKELEGLKKFGED